MMMNSECFLKLSEFGLAKTFAEASETSKQQELLRACRLPH